jgi:hypothetical protein
MVDFERGTPIMREVCARWWTNTRFPSPALPARRRALAPGARTRHEDYGEGAGWHHLGDEPGALHPGAELVARKFSAIRSAGGGGVMASWTLGTYPSPNWGAAQAFYRGDAPGVEEAVARVAADLYGKEGKAEALQAWKIFAGVSRTTHLPTVWFIRASCSGDRRIPGGPVPRVSDPHPAQLRQFKLDESFRAGDRGARVRAHGARWQVGIDTLTAACKLAPAAARTDVASDLRVSRAVGSTSRASPTSCDSIRPGERVGKVRRNCSEKKSGSPRVSGHRARGCPIRLRAVDTVFYLPLDSARKSRPAGTTWGKLRRLSGPCRCAGKKCRRGSSWWRR